MTAFHSGSIPQSSSFISTTQQSLAPASSNVQTPPPNAKIKVSEQLFVLSLGQYLSWYELEHRYGPARESFKTDESYKSARLDWVTDIEMNDPPFHVAWAAMYKRQEVEDTWAGLPAQRRQHAETLALSYRYRAVVQAPSREVPLDALPLPFTSLEAQYFNIPERKLVNNSDTMRKRSTWLRELGLLEPVYHALCSTSEQQVTLESAYSKLTVVKRRAIEAKAKFLKVKLKPPKPLFKDFEEQYFVHKKEDFSGKDDHKAKRGEWLRAIGLDDEPFCWYPYNTTELGIAQEEKTEVAWNDLGLAARQAIEAKASEFNKVHTWGAS